MKTKKIFFLCLYTTLAVTFMVGCDSSSDAPSDDNAKVYAKAGSTFDFAGYQKDSSYNKIPGSDSTWRDSVTSGPAAFGGKANVITILRTNGDTAVFAYEENGDISFYQPNGIDEGDFPIEGVGVGWWQIPFGSKATNDTLFYVDSNVTIQGFPASVQIAGVASYIGAGTFNLNSESFATERAKVTITVHLDAGLVNFTVINDVVIDYAKKLGYYVVQDIKQTQPAMGASDDGGSYEVLIGYSLKK